MSCVCLRVGYWVCAQVPARLGVRRMWVHPRARRRGLAAILLSWACRKAVPIGARPVAPASELAFTPPTEAGLATAAAVTGSTTILVYTDA